MEKPICKHCDKEILKKEDEITFFHEGHDANISYHRECYATKFNAPHAKIDFGIDSKIDSKKTI